MRCCVCKWGTVRCCCCCFCFFFFNDTATTEIYTLSLHDALPICLTRPKSTNCSSREVWRSGSRLMLRSRILSMRLMRSEEHTSELQSQSTISYAVFCLKKKKKHHAYMLVISYNVDHLMTMMNWSRSYSLI